MPYTKDGQDGVLAHAFYPKDGRVHFDDDEHWSIDGHIGKHLELIATHEFGHALGLHHSSMREAIMSQSYPGYTPFFRLHEDDIKAITALYGARPTTIEPTKGSTSAGQSINMCKMKFDDVVRLPDGEYYVFRKEWIYKLNTNLPGVEEGWPKLFVKVYEDFPSTPDAVTYSHRDYRLFVFKGSKVWRYYKSRLEKGFPAEIRRKPPTPIRAAFEWKDGFIYGLTARQVYIFDDHNLSWTHISSLRGIFPDAVYGIEAAVSDGQNSLYLFKGYWYYEVDSVSKRSKGGYPKHKHSSWLGCTRSLRSEDAYEIS